MKAAALLALMVPVTAAGGTAAEDIAATVAEEAYIAEVPVSGRPRAGVMEQVTGARPRAGALWLRLTEETAGDPLCIEISSRNGRYTLRLDAEAPASAPPGPVRVVYVPGFPQAFADADSDHLAVLARVGGGCDRPGEGVVPAAWTRPASPGLLQVFVNAARLHAELVVPRGDGAPVVVPCTKLPGGQSIAFDSRCDLDLTALPAESRLADARLFRKRGPNRAPPLPLPILVALPR